uniref:condensin-2 complex subunit D3 isoform X2 n=1 Tax=Myxine glutinosa TaxID=7769 RepID=UPI00358EBBE4
MQCPLYSTGWADAVWEQDFTDVQPLRQRQAQQVFLGGMAALQELVVWLQRIVQDKADDVSDIWNDIQESGGSQEVLVAFLHHLVGAGQKRCASSDRKEQGTYAAAVYFLLLTVPGSVAYKVFHPVMLERCVAMLNNLLPQKDSHKPRQKPVQGGKKSRGATKHQASAMERDDREHDEEMDVDDDDDDASDKEEEVLSPLKLQRLREALKGALQALALLLQDFPLNDHPQCVSLLIKGLVELSKEDSESLEGLPDITTTRCLQGKQSMSRLAFFALFKLCAPHHGSEEEVLRMIFQHLLSRILMVGDKKGGGTTQATIPQHQRISRDHALRFVRLLVKELEQKAMPTLRTLLQHICVKVPDKAEYRMYAAQAVCQLLSCMDCSSYVVFLKWLHVFSRNAKCGYRVFSVDVVSVLLGDVEHEADDSIPLENLKYFSHKFLLIQLVLCRCCDRAPMVRTRALVVLAQCLDSSRTTCLNGMQELLQGGMQTVTIFCRMLGSTTPQCTDKGRKSSTNADTNVQQNTGAFRSVEIAESEAASDVVEGQEILKMLQNRVGDEKLSVRKAALQVLVVLLCHELLPLNKPQLDLLQEHCRDPALSVRKQALQSLTQLLKMFPKSVAIQTCWLRSLLPAVLDVETSIQEKVLECFDTVIIGNVKSCEEKELVGPQCLAWSLLEILALPKEAELSLYLKKVCQMLMQRSTIPANLAGFLLSHTDSERVASAWMLLAKVAAPGLRLNSHTVVQRWEDAISAADVPASTLCNMLTILGAMAKSMTCDVRSQIMGHLSAKLCKFFLPLEVIASVVSSLNQLNRAQKEEEKTEMNEGDECLKKVIGMCEDYISDIVFTESGRNNMDIEKLICHIFTLGEVAQLVPAHISKKIPLLIQFITASPTLEMDCFSDSGGRYHSSQMSTWEAMPTTVRAHAFITFGKLCLQNEDIAKRGIAALVQELELSPHVPIRNNVVIVLCDLCMCYPSLVDHHIPRITNCLKDKDPLIRRQTLILLTRLFQEEYLKWKGPLFYRFASVLVDKDSSIQRLAEFCLTNVLLKKQPAVIFQHFVECIFYFNNFEKYEKYRLTQSERELKLFTFKGEKHKETRMTIYRFLLNHLTDEQRFKLTTRLCNGTLGAFVDGPIPLDAEAGQMLSDIFLILGSREIKLSTMHGRGVEEEIPEEGELAMAHAVMQVAQKKLISQVQKRNYVENIIPTVRSLKIQLEHLHMPALKDLMAFLREILKDYRSEVQEVFSGDKQLVSELEYDLRKYEELHAAPQSEKDLPQGVPQSPGAVQMNAVPQLEANDPQSPADACHTPMVSNHPNIRQISLATAVILNSAVKIAESLRKERCAPASQSPASPAPRSSPTAQAQSDGSEHEAVMNSSKPPLANALAACDYAVQQKVASPNIRAISTPGHTICGVTFNAEMSAILSENLSDVEMQPNKKDHREGIICLKSPNRPSLRVQQWKVNSPSTPRSRRAQKTRISRKRTLSPSN